MYLKRILATALLMSVGAAGMASADDYVLTGHDRLLLRAVHWNSDIGAYVPLDAVTGEYTITASGNLSLPLVGEIRAQGETTNSLSALIVNQLRRQAGFTELPDIALEVIGHQPIYALGAVNAPGSYAFTPGLTVRQVLALAGGQTRPGPETPGDALTTALRLDGEIRVLITEITQYQAEQARLLADVAALAEGDGVPEDAGAATEGLDDLQKEILASTFEARAARGEQIRDLQRVLTEQITRLSTQIDLRTELIAQSREELDNISSLQERGLVANNRVNSLSASVNEHEAKRLDLEIARLTAQQQLNLAQRDELALVDTARAEDLQRLDAIESEISTRQIRLETARTLYAQAAAVGLNLQETDATTETSYLLTRLVDGVSTTTAVEPTERVAPGDTLEVVVTIGSKTSEF